MEDFDVVEVGSFSVEPLVWSGDVEMTSWAGVRQQVAEKLHHCTRQSAMYMEKLANSQQASQLLAALLQALLQEELSWEQ